MRHNPDEHPTDPELAEEARGFSMTVPERKDTLKEDARNIAETLKHQLGVSDQWLGEVVITSNEPGLAARNKIEGRAYLYLYKDALSKPRELLVRLIGHEIQHAWNEQHLDADKYRKLANLEDFRELQQRFANRFDALKMIEKDQEQQLLLHQNITHYTGPNEILARLRAFQIYLAQGQPIETAEPHELFEILIEKDIKWLDPDYLDQRITSS